MSKILMSYNPNGGGHKFNIEITAARLRKAGHSVVVIPGVYGVKQHLVYDAKGRLTFWGSLKANIKYQHSKEFVDDRAYLIDAFLNYEPDLVISDFDPFIGKIAENFGVKVLGLSSQLAFNLVKKQRRGFYQWLYRLKLADYKQTFNTSIIPTWVVDRTGPLIHEELIGVKPPPALVCHNILIHATKEMVKYFPFDLTYSTNAEFLDKLVNCEYIISTAGHNLLGEALYLRKPVLIFPIINHEEQQFNARVFENRGYGMIGDWSNPQKSCREFKLRLPIFRNNLARVNITPGNEFISAAVQRVLDTIEISKRTGIN